jgi:uncharacterized protein (TIGR02996 family)
MTTEDDFHAILDANPDDHHTRLVFADWLQEQGDPRAEGYRALGQLRLRPQDHGYVAQWGRTSNKEARRRDSLLHPKWWEATGAINPSTEGIGANVKHWWTNHDTRRHAEDAAAIAFSKLPPKLKKSILPKTESPPPSLPPNVKAALALFHKARPAKIGSAPAVKPLVGAILPQTTERQAAEHDQLHDAFRRSRGHTPEAEAGATDDYYRHLAATGHPLRTPVGAYRLQQDDDELGDRIAKFGSAPKDEGSVDTSHGPYIDSRVGVSGESAGDLGTLHFFVSPMVNSAGRRLAFGVHVRSRRDVDALLRHFPEHVKRKFANKFATLPDEHPRDFVGRQQNEPVDWRPDETMPEDYYAKFYARFVRKALASAK